MPALFDGEGSRNKAGGDHPAERSHLSAKGSPNCCRLADPRCRHSVKWGLRSMTCPVFRHRCMSVREIKGIPGNQASAPAPSPIYIYHVSTPLSSTFADSDSSSTELRKIARLARQDVQHTTPTLRQIARRRLPLLRGRSSPVRAPVPLSAPHNSWNGCVSVRYSAHSDKQA